MLVLNLWIKIVSGAQMSFKIGIDFARSLIRLFLFLPLINVDMVGILSLFHAVIAREAFLHLLEELLVVSVVIIHVFFVALCSLLWRFQKVAVNFFIVISASPIKTKIAAHEVIIENIIIGIVVGGSFTLFILA